MVINTSFTRKSGKLIFNTTKRTAEILLIAGIGVFVCVASFVTLDEIKDELQIGNALLIMPLLVAGLGVLVLTNTWFYRLETIIDIEKKSMTIMESKFLWMSTTTVISLSEIKNFTDPESVKSQFSNDGGEIPVTVNYLSKEIFNNNSASATIFYVSTNGLVATIPYPSLYQELSAAISSKDNGQSSLP